jgi:hypothetical protein
MVYRLSRENAWRFHRIEGIWCTLQTCMDFWMCAKPARGVVIDLRCREFVCNDQSFGNNETRRIDMPCGVRYRDGGCCPRLHSASQAAILDGITDGGVPVIEASGDVTGFGMEELI